MYGIDAPYFYMTETLCWPIIEGMIKAELIAEPMKVNEHIRELSLKLQDNPVIQICISLCGTNGPLLRKSAHHRDVET